jgi:2,3-diketo-5-methylthio-1-phosphopentane phosphatase
MIEQTSMDEINKIVDGISVDPTFMEFFNWIKLNKTKFIIVSDGFRSYIERTLTKTNIPLKEFEIKANDMKLIDGKIKLDFLTPQCDHDCANCKYSHVNELKKSGYKIIYIGDGLSDIFPAKQLADIIFAKENEDLAMELEGDSRLNLFSNFLNIKRILEEQSILN